MKSVNEPYFSRPCWLSFHKIPWLDAKTTSSVMSFNWMDSAQWRFEFHEFSNTQKINNVHKKPQTCILGHLFDSRWIKNIQNTLRKTDAMLNICISRMRRMRNGEISRFDRPAVCLLAICNRLPRVCEWVATAKKRLVSSKKSKRDRWEDERRRGDAEFHSAKILDIMNCFDTGVFVVYIRETQSHAIQALRTNQLASKLKWVRHVGLAAEPHGKRNGNSLRSLRQNSAANFLIPLGHTQREKWKHFRAIAEAPPQQKIFMQLQKSAKNFKWPAKPEYKPEDTYPTSHVIWIHGEEFKKIWMWIVLTLQQFHVGMTVGWMMMAGKTESKKAVKERWNTLVLV